MTRRFLVVGNEQNAPSPFVLALQQTKNPIPIFFVQIAGWLVRQNQTGV